MCLILAGLQKYSWPCDMLALGSLGLGLRLTSLEVSRGKPAVPSCASCSLPAATVTARLVTRSARITAGSSLSQEFSTPTGTHIFAPFGHCGAQHHALLPCHFTCMLITCSITPGELQLLSWLQMKVPTNSRGKMYLHLQLY